MTDREALELLIRRVDDFSQTVNFWMSDEAWDALTDLTDLADGIFANGKPK